MEELGGESPISEEDDEEGGGRSSCIVFERDGPTRVEVCGNLPDV